MRLSFLLPLSLALLLALSTGINAAERRHQRFSGVPSLAEPLALDSSLVAPATAQLGLDPRYKDNVADAWITRGVLVAFNESVPAQLKEDYLNSILYAKANCRKVDFWNAPQALVDCVEKDMTAPLGWRRDRLHNFQPVARDATHPLAEDVLNILSYQPSPGNIVFPESYRRLARVAVESLKVEDEAFINFRNFSTNGTRNVFLLSVASIERDDLIVFTATFYVTTTAQGAQLLWTTYPLDAAKLSYSIDMRTPWTPGWTEKHREDIRKALNLYLPQAIYQKAMKL